MTGEEFYQELGRNIRIFRKMNHMTQKELAYAVGKSLACISKYEKGEIAMDMYTLQTIAAHLGVSAEQLTPEQTPPKQSEGADANLCPLFRTSPLYLYWYRGGKRTLVRHVLEVDPSASRVVCYMEADNPSDYKNCRYIMFGTIFTKSPNTCIFATNPAFEQDFMFACFSNVDIFDSKMTGFVSCLNRSYHITSTKCFISTSPNHSIEEILQAILVTKSELADFKRSNFFTFGAHQDYV